MQAHLLVVTDKIDEFAISRDCDSDEWNHSGTVNVSAHWEGEQAYGGWRSRKRLWAGEQEENENPLCVGWGISVAEQKNIEVMLLLVRKKPRQASIPPTPVPHTLKSEELKLQRKNEGEGRDG